LDDDARALMGVRREDDDDAITALTDALDLIADPTEAKPEERASTSARPHLVAVPDADDDETGDAADVTAEPVAAPAYTDVTVTIQTPAEAADAEPKETPKKAPARKSKPRKGRASVPSWDEILFGATQKDD
jgi:hypothetical protein